MFGIILALVLFVAFTLIAPLGEELSQRTCLTEYAAGIIVALVLLPVALLVSHVVNYFLLLPLGWFSLPRARPVNRALSWLYPLRPVKRKVETRTYLSWKELKTVLKVDLRAFRLTVAGLERELTKENDLERDAKGSREAQERNLADAVGQNWLAGTQLRWDSAARLEITHLLEATEDLRKKLVAVHGRLADPHRLDDDAIIVAAYWMRDLLRRTGNVITRVKREKKPALP